MAAPARLYLDTARLGLMSPSAQLAAGDFVRLAGEGALGLYGNPFFASGFDSLPDDCQPRFPALSNWRGIRSLKKRLCRAIDTDENRPVMLSSRTTSLMRLAAKLATERCKSILAVDTDWLPYRETLKRECYRGETRLVDSKMWWNILTGRLSHEAVVEAVVNDYRSQSCDGLFITAVSNTGIRLPVRAIVQRLKTIRPPRFVVIDGAQDYCHVEDGREPELGDLYLAGCHKWLCAYQAMGVAFCGRRETHKWIAERVGSLLQTGHVDDPLLHFTQASHRGIDSGHGETVNLAPLFSCHGALLDVPTNQACLLRLFDQRMRNAETLANLARAVGWRPPSTRIGLRSGILLLQAIRKSARRQSAEGLSDRFRRLGIVLTVYHNGLLRLSMLGRDWSGEELDLLMQALRAAA